MQVNVKVLIETVKNDKKLSGVAKFALLNALNRLDRYEYAIESGELKQIPIQPKTRIFLIREGRKVTPYNPNIEEVIVEKVILTKKGWYIKHSANSFSETSIRSEGKTWFRTKAKAEAKLKELAGKK